MQEYMRKRKRGRTGRRRSNVRTLPVCYVWCGVCRCEKYGVCTFSTSDLAPRPLLAAAVRLADGIHEVARTLLLILHVSHHAVHPCFRVYSYLGRILAAPEGAEVDLEAVAARIIEETASGAAGAVAGGRKAIPFADFSRVMQAADLRLYLPL
jgi:hypothetical protein